VVLQSECGCVYIDFQLASAVDLHALAGYNTPDLAAANWAAHAGQGPLTAAIQAAGLQLNTNTTYVALACTCHCFHCFCFYTFNNLLFKTMLELLNKLLDSSSATDFNE
jgi:hypothetical protein